MSVHIYQGAYTPDRDRSTASLRPTADIASVRRYRSGTGQSFQAIGLGKALIGGSLIACYDAGNGQILLGVRLDAFSLVAVTALQALLGETRGAGCRPLSELQRQHARAI